MMDAASGWAGGIERGGGNGASCKRKGMVLSCERAQFKAVRHHALHVRDAVRSAVVFEVSCRRWCCSRLRRIEFPMQKTLVLVKWLRHVMVRASADQAVLYISHEQHRN